MSKHKANHLENEDVISDEVFTDDPASDIELDYEDDVIEEEGLTARLKKLRAELKDSKKQSQEYLTGWQKERASFANYKADEEKKRSERLATLKLGIVEDFFPVLDSFDMAFANRESWEKVDQSWRTGVEYIYNQLRNTIESYGISIIDEEGVAFNPAIHDPVAMIPVDTQKQDGQVITVIQKGYRTKDSVLRPAKVRVGQLPTN